MVRAILDGRKTATRRVIKFPENSFTGKAPAADNIKVCENTLFSKEISFLEDPSYIFDIKPPCRRGDILYVRETWHRYTKRVGRGENCHLHEFYGYRASIANSEDAGEKWHPSIHMPKEAARIWLKVKDVRVERLQEIDGRGILAEGIDNGRSNPAMGKRWENMQRMAFSGLWDSTIRKADIDRYGWDANPWVWVIGFERCKKPEPCIIKGIRPASDKRPCIGYQKSKEDDEPCNMCKGCERCDGEEPESEG